MNNELFFAPNISIDWKLVPNKYLFISRSEKVGENFSNYQLLSLTKKGVIAKDINSNEGKLPASFEGYQTVSKGDMIFCLFDLDMSAVFSGLSAMDGMITSAYDVYAVNNKLIDSNYCKYWFDYVFTGRYFKNYSKNIRYTVGGEAFGQIKTPIPSLEEQKKIGDFLDKKINQIDELIANQKKQIEKLEEYKQSIITKAVTKGLDPNAEMKDSGVEWIGEISEGWNVLKIKYCYFNRDKKYECGNYPYIALENIESKSGKYIFTGTNANYSLDGTIVAHKNDTIFGKLRPYLAKAFTLTEDSCVSSEFAVFYSANCSTTFLKYLFLSSKFIDVINSSTYGTKMPRANIEFINNLYISIPPMDEQNEITNYLEDKCKNVDYLISTKNVKINKLKDYKKSLIYEYVTGKRRI